MMNMLPLALTRPANQTGQTHPSSDKLLIEDHTGCFLQ